MMLGSSRESLSALSDELEGLRDETGFAQLAPDLRAVADLLDRESPLRSILADAGQPTAVRRGLVEEVLGPRVAPLASHVLTSVVDHRWSSDTDLVSALETLAAQATFAVADSDGTLDATEEELFRFGRAVDASPELQMTLTSPSLSAQAKGAIVDDLLRGRSTEATRAVLVYAVGHLHGQRIDTVVTDLVELAAEQRERVVAEVTVAAPLEESQRSRLADLLSRLKGRTVRLNVAVDPAVQGGVHVRIGDEVIDGTVAARLEQARRAIMSQ